MIGDVDETVTTQSCTSAASSARKIHLLDRGARQIHNGRQVVALEG